MYFISTRGGEKVTAADAVKRGIAPDGGLYVPDKIPHIKDAELEGMLEMSYPELVAGILGLFFTELDKEELLNATEEAYAGFSGDAARLVKVDDGVFVLELFHGTTCSSKDMAVATLPYLFKKALGDGEKYTVVVATSGDTGKAAFERFDGIDGARVIAFYPAEGMSKMQKLQLVTDEGKRVKAVAVRGSFDDCQSAVKKLLQEGSEGATLVTANSMNFGALAPRIAYYFSAYADMLSSGQLERREEIDFYIPCGNFGNAVAAYYAKLMGLPIRRIHCATNENNALSAFFKTGEFKKGELVKSTSPNMDVLCPSDLERLIFEASGRNAKLTARRMASLENEGSYSLTEEELGALSETFDGGFATEETCVEAMYDVFVDIGYVLDTNAGCAMKVVQDWYEKNKKDETKAVIVAADSPYKFPQDVLYAMTGNDVKDSFKGVKRLHDATAMAVPNSIKELKEKPVRFSGSVDKRAISDELKAFLSE